MALSKETKLQRNQVSNCFISPAVLNRQATGGKGCSDLTCHIQLRAHELQEH